MRTDLTSVDGTEFDAAIIGGGINGTSAAQHLAAAGYRTLLVEKADFGAGSSSRSSRLIHCGLRYLAPGISAWEWALQPIRLKNALRTVKRAMEERRHLVVNQPSRARRINFAYPVWDDSTYTPWQVMLALRLLTTLGPKEVPLNPRLVSASEVRDTPLLNHLRDPGRIRGVCLFDEYQLDWPERAAVDMALDAERMGATVLNYTEASKLERQGDSWRVELRDSFDPGRTVAASAKFVLNLAGIWIDRVNALSGRPIEQKVLGTKGCHIVVQLPPECREWGVATLNRQREPFYCIPWRGLHYFGPTETVYKDDIEDIHVTEAETEWLLGEANHLFPSLQLRRADVVFTWAGVRPLTHDPAYSKGKRLRVIHELDPEGLPNMLALTNGSVAHNRSAGIELVEAVKRRIAPSGAAQQPDYRERNFPDNQNSPPLLDHDTTVKLADLRYAAQHEHPATLADLLFRRTGAGWSRTMASEAALKAAESVADVMNWDAAEIDRQVRDYCALLHRQHGLSSEPIAEKRAM